MKQVRPLQCTGEHGRSVHYQHQHADAAACIEMLAATCLPQPSCLGKTVLPAAATQPPALLNAGDYRQVCRAVPPSSCQPLVISAAYPSTRPSLSSEATKLKDSMHSTTPQQPASSRANHCQPTRSRVRQQANDLTVR